MFWIISKKPVEHLFSMEYQTNLEFLFKNVAGDSTFAKETHLKE